MAAFMRPQFVSLISRTLYWKHKRYGTIRNYEYIIEVLCVVAGTEIKYWSVLHWDIWGSLNGTAKDEGILILRNVGSDVSGDMDATRLGSSMALPFCRALLLQ